jgi:hypothetical protein
MCGVVLIAKCIVPLVKMMNGIVRQCHSTSRIRRTALLVLNLSTRWRWMVSLTTRSFYPHRKIWCPLTASGWATETVWTFWRRENYQAPAGIQTPDLPARSKWVMNWEGRVHGLVCFPSWPMSGELLWQERTKNLQYNAANRSFEAVGRLKYLTKAVCNRNSIPRNWSGIRSESGQTAGLRSSFFACDI